MTGSTGLHLQGVPVEPNDIDIQTTAKGAYQIEDALGYEVGMTVGFRQAERIRLHFGRGMLRGLQVEIMEDIEKLSPTDGWLPTPPLNSIVAWTVCNGLWIPVLDLKYEIMAYESIGREERVQTIRRFVERGNFCTER